MAWEYDLVLMTRVLVNDLNTPQKHTDAYIQQVIVTAGILVETDVELDYNYVIDVSGVTISPDPVTEQDLMFQSLVTLKSACILTQGDFRQAVSQGIRVRDGDSMVDTSVGFRGYRDIITLGPCASYEKLKWDIQSGKSDGRSAGSVGGAVMSPARAPDTSSLISDVGLFFDSIALSLGYNRSNRY